MHVHASLAQRTEQGLLLAPRMLQAIEVLQLSCVELCQRVEEELLRNETLEAIPPARIECVGRRAAPPSRGDDERLPSWLDQVADATDDLLAHVRDQVLGMELDEGLRARVLRLAEGLDDRGFLGIDEDELVAATGDDDLRLALGVLRSLQPTGLGARDAVAALMAQLAPDDGDRDLLERLLRGHLDAVARDDRDQLADALAIATGEVDRLLDRLRELEPWPAARFRGRAARPVWPDLVVVEDRSGLRVAVDGSALPELTLHDDYVTMAGSPDTPPPVRRYLRRKVAAARALIEAVQGRSATLERVGKEVLSQQADYLTVGDVGLRPLRMADVAERLGLHTSTISRAVAGKHLQTPRGIVPLRMFFDGGAAGTVGRRSVQARIGELLAGESGSRPMSDEEIVQRLSSEGHRVARRTVAKYRTELGIASSRRRRKESP